MRGHLREVFPGLDSGPNCSEGHYSIPWKNVPQVTPHILLNLNLQKKFTSYNFSKTSAKMASYKKKIVFSPLSFVARARKNKYASNIKYVILVDW